MQVATWNINSIRMRLPRLVSWLKRRQPDIVCLQETKVVDQDFPMEPLQACGYHCLIHGQKSYNGVAILSRQAALKPLKRLPGDPSDLESRFLSAVIGETHVVNVYAPNGGEVGSAKYDFKLKWYGRLLQFLASSLSPEDRIALCGDFNVAPEDRDVWDPEQWRGKILFSEPEKEALRRITNWGLADALRIHHQDGGLYTWWDYRAGAFHRGWGVRIDHILLSAPLARRCLDVSIERDERKGPKPSDHAPIVASIE